MSCKGTLRGLSVSSGGENQGVFMLSFGLLSPSAPRNAQPHRTALLVKDSILVSMERSVPSPTQASSHLLSSIYPENTPEEDPRARKSSTFAGISNSPTESTPIKKTGWLVIYLKPPLT